MVSEDVLRRLEAKYPIDTEISPQLVADILKDIRLVIGGTILHTEMRPREQLYFRVRPGIFDRTLRKEFFSPPPEYTGAGRCNLVGHPVFYASEHPRIALNECGIDVGHTAHMSLWRSKTKSTKYALCGRSEDIGSIRLRKHADTKSFHTENKIFERTQKHLSKLFQLNNWSFSAAISYAAIYEDCVDGIEYPDSKNRLVYNYALNPKHAEQLEFVKAWRCGPSPNHPMKVCYWEVANENNGIVKWRDIDGDGDLPEKMNLPTMANILRDSDLD